MRQQHRATPVLVSSAAFLALAVNLHACGNNTPAPQPASVVAANLPASAVTLRVLILPQDGSVPDGGTGPAPFSATLPVTAGSPSASLQLPAGLSGPLIAGIAAVDKSGCVIAEQTGMGIIYQSRLRRRPGLISEARADVFPGCGHHVSPPQEIAVDFSSATPLAKPDCRNQPVLLSAISVEDAAVDAGLSLSGFGFRPGLSVTVSLNGKSVAAQVNYESPVLVLANIPKDAFPAGMPLTVQVKNADGSGDTRSDLLML